MTVVDRHAPPDPTPRNEYEPWMETGEEELAYFKRRYLEMSTEAAQWEQTAAKWERRVREWEDDLDTANTQLKAQAQSHAATSELMARRLGETRADALKEAAAHVRGVSSEDYDELLSNLASDIEAL